MFLYAQDDAFYPPGVRQFIEHVKWPEGCGLLKLWTPSGHSYNVPQTGIAKTPSVNLVGALGYVMPRSTVELLLNSSVMANWKGSRGWAQGKHVRALDMAVGQALAAEGLSAYYFTRSLIDHFEPIPNNSTLDNGPVEGFRKSYRYVGDDATFEDIKELYS